MADKQSVLSIVLRAVNQTSATVRAVDKDINSVGHGAGHGASPLADIEQKLDGIGKSAGISALTGVLNTIGHVAKEAFALISEGVQLAVSAVRSLVDHFATLGKTANRLGVTADFLASMRYAAERSGASIESLDEGLQTFTQNMGQARAGTGRMLKFLNVVSAPLMQQLLATKDNEQAFRMLADAMAKLKDPQKQLALAQKTVGDAALAPLLLRGSKGLYELQGRYAGLAGSQEDAAEAGVEVEEAIVDIKAASSGLEAALMRGLAPALMKIIPLMTQWLAGHREEITQWIVNFGEQLPAAIDKVIAAVVDAKKWVDEVAASMGGWGAISKWVTGMLSGQLTTSIAAIKAGVSELVAGVRVLWAAFEASPIGMLIENFAALEDQIELITDSLQNLGKLKGLLGPLGLLLPGGDDEDKSGVDKVMRPSDHRAGRRDGIDFVVQPTPPTPASEVRVKVDFANAPRGMRATADPRGATDVDLSVGYQMLGLGL